METKHTPATPLPWSFDRGSIDAQSTDVRAPSLASSVRAEDGRYIAHAANAYPQLVAALRQMVGAHGNVERWWETEGEHRFQNQIDNLNLPRPTAEVIRQQVTDETAALLRSLGEDA